MSGLQLVIGNKNLSSWSLRPWLLLAEAGIPFEERRVAFGSPGWADAAGAPSVQVPLLRHGDLAIWESLAICDYLAELHPEKQLWPADRAVRAVARAVSGEVQASFATLRQECPMNVVLQAERRLSPAAQAELERIDALWTDCRGRFGAGGPLLFGRFSIADAMFAPAALRVRSYHLPLTPKARGYCDALLALPSLRRWIADAETEVASGLAEPAAPGPLLSRAEAEQRAQRWAQAFCRKDVAGLLALYDPSIRFRSPLVPELTAGHEVVGLEELRRYWTLAVAQAGQLRVSIEELLWDAESSTLVLHYSVYEDGLAARACELFVFGPSGKAVRGESFTG
jgi:glutathione S-transferase